LRRTINDKKWELDKLLIKIKIEKDTTQTDEKWHYERPSEWQKRLRNKIHHDTDQVG
jgi:hypothetical protein